METSVDNSREGDSGSGDESTISNLRHAFRGELDRAAVVAEAKILVEQLSEYLDMLSAWALEGLEEATDDAQ